MLHQSLGNANGKADQSNRKEEQKCLEEGRCDSGTDWSKYDDVKLRAPYCMLALLRSVFQMKACGVITTETKSKNKERTSQKRNLHDPNIVLGSSLLICIPQDQIAEPDANGTSLTTLKCVRN